MGKLGGLLFGISLFASVLVAHLVAERLRERYVRGQNRLLDRCRALLILGAKALETGAPDEAERLLATIRRLEAQWRYGRSLPYRLAKAGEAMFLGGVAFVGVRIAGLVAMAAVEGTREQLLTLEGAWVFFLLAIFGPLHAAAAYVDLPVFIDRIDDCGDRLEDLIRSPRDVLAFEEEAEEEEADQAQNGAAGHEPRVRDGLSPWQVLGVPREATRAQIDAARRQLVRELHPDRWMRSGPVVVKAREEALKRVNAAYDAMREGLEG
ncbi:MAG: J domain-containing protein [Hyphomicrobiaceae bacterium]